MGTQQNLKMGDILLRQGLINEAQLAESLALQKSTDKKLGEILVEKGIINEHQLLQFLAAAYQLPMINLDETVIDERGRFKRLPHPPLRL